MADRTAQASVSRSADPDFASLNPGYVASLLASRILPRAAGKGDRAAQQRGGRGVGREASLGAVGPLHDRRIESAQAERCVEAGGHRPRRGWPGPQSPWVFGTAVEHGPSILRLLSSTDDREHVPHARQGSVRTRDQGQSNVGIDVSKDSRPRCAASPAKSRCYRRCWAWRAPKRISNARSLLRANNKPNPGSFARR